MTPDSSPPSAGAASRRRVLCGLATAGLAGPLLAACGGTGQTTQLPRGEAGDVLAATADVPVGEGLLVADKGVFVTQPQAGTFKAFSAVCTHQSCQVDAALNGGNIHCGCHGSEFAVADGSVVTGPAEEPLPSIPVKVEGGNVVRA